MAWNQPGDDQGGTPRRSGAPVAAGDWLRRLRQRWSAPRGARSSLYGLGGSVALLVWLLTGIYQIDDGQSGVLQRFGAYAGVRGAGAGWHLPWPIETLTTIDLGRLNSADFQSRMFTADADLINITCSVQYQVRDARQALFAVRELDSTVREVGEAATRELVAQRPIAELIGGAGRAPLSESLRTIIQQRLDALATGVRVLAVDLTDVQVPEPVLGAQREVVQAGEDRERLTKEAQGYASELLARAQGAAQRQRLDADGYRLQLLRTAEGDAARFDQTAAAYERAPEVTRQRLYIETIESILARSRKVIIDGKVGANTFYLPLDKLMDPAGAHGSGVTGTVGTGGSPGTIALPGPAGSVAPVNVAPGATGPAGTVTAPVTGPTAAPAATTSPAATPAPAETAPAVAAPAVSERENRSRERGTR